MRMIDATALKEELSRALLCEEPNRRYKQIIGIIDNAPTVEEKSYDMGYQEGHIDGVLQAEKLYARPMGKWIVDGGVIACNMCGRIVLGASGLYNFCSNCGAEMITEEKPNDNS